MLADQLEAGEVDEQVTEKLLALEQCASELRHDFSSVLGAGGLQQREATSQPPGREHGAREGRGFLRNRGELREAWEPNIGVEHGRGAAGQVAQRES